MLVKLKTFIIVLSVLTLANFEIVIANIDDGLIAYYTFDGNIMDESGNGNDATKNGNISYVEGILGEGAKLNGGANIKTPVAFNGTDENQHFTISFWGLVNDLDKGIFITNYNYGDGCSSIHMSAKTIGISGKFKENVSNGYTLSYYPIDISNFSQLHNWTHYLLTYDNNSERIYINGLLKEEKKIGSNQIGGHNGSSKYPRDDTDFDRLLNIGMYNNAFGYAASSISESSLNGVIDDLRIYNRALTENEITKLYRQVKTRNEHVVFENYFHETTIDNNYCGRNDSIDDWIIEYSNVKDWQYEINETAITAISITPNSVKIELIDNDIFYENSLSSINMKQQVPSLNNFTFETIFEWDEYEEISAMQRLIISLNDFYNNSIVKVGFSDLFINETGTKLIKVSNNKYEDNEKLDFKGEASLKIQRLESKIDVFWDDNLLFTGQDPRLLDNISIEFSYYPYKNLETNIQSTMGQMSIKHIKLSKIFHCFDLSNCNLYYYDKNTKIDLVSVIKALQVMSGLKSETTNIITKPNAHFSYHINDGVVYLIDESKHDKILTNWNWKIDDKTFSRKTNAITSICRFLNKTKKVQLDIIDEIGIKDSTVKDISILLEPAEFTVTINDKIYFEAKDKTNSPEDYRWRLYSNGREEIYQDFKNHTSFKGSSNCNPSLYIALYIDGKYPTVRTISNNLEISEISSLYCTGMVSICSLPPVNIPGDDWGFPDWIEYCKCPCNLLNE